MLKALEILKSGITFMEKAKEANPLSIDYLDKEIEIYKEAIEEIEQTIKTIDDCAGDESDCRIMYEKLYKLINGEER